MNKYVSQTLIIIAAIPVMWFVWLFASVSLEKEEKIRKSWKPSIGVVVESSVEKQSGGKGVKYCPRIFVEHTQRETPSRAKLAFSDAQCSPIKSQTEKLVKEHAIGRSIEILVNPANPKQAAVPSYSVHPAHYVLIACVVFFCGTLLWIIFAPVFRIVRAVIADERSAK
jgi:hypothetical protein